jgi:hypothetical protein
MLSLFIGLNIYLPNYGGLLLQGVVKFRAFSLENSTCYHL